MAALTPSQNPLEVRQSAGQDFFQFKNAQGSVLSWIDSAGQGQGTLGGGINTVNMTLSLVQLRALGTVPSNSAVTVVPAAGPNSVIVPLCFASYFHFGGTIYNGALINLGYGRDAVSTGFFEFGLTGNNVTNQTHDSICAGAFGAVGGSPVVVAATPTNFNAVNNASIVVFVGAALGTTGNGTFQFQMKYMVYQF